MEGPVGTVVLVQVHAVLLAQLAHLPVELVGDVGVGSWDGTGHALGTEETVDLWRGGEDVVGGACAGVQHQPHIGLRQVEVARGEKEGGVRPSIR